MPNVHILSPDVISKIAAGEVIERPASVIKELIENSLDAGTDTIDLFLEDAGKKLIRLTDTGAGIRRDDIETIFQRHATSKIQAFDDLFDIHSLGFRGEALYSIGAIADVVLKTHASEDDSGWEIHVRGGKRIGLKPASYSRGTEIEVKELFFNTPARRKFLKSNLSEINQIVSTFIPYTLLHPDCRFRLTHEGKTLLDLAPAPQAIDRIAAALNLEPKHLLSAEQPFPEKETHVRMIIGDANIVRARRDLQFIFVNGRPVQSKNISFHMNEAYRLILPPQHFSFFCVYLDVPADQVDVNIHPTKREVKMKEESAVCSILRAMVETTLMSRSPAREVTLTTPSPIAMDTGDIPAEKFSETVESPADHALAPRPTSEYAWPQQTASAQDIASLFKPLLTEKQPEALHQRLAQAKFVGIFVNKFLLFESGKTLLVVDQHAAQERITFERLIQQMDKGKIEVQNLLSPVLIRGTVTDILTWEEIQNALEELGFSTTRFDDETIAVHSHPVLLKDVERAVRDVLAGENPARCDHESLARRACRASVMAGDPLDATRANHIRKELLVCRDPFTCPHGRPTLIEISENFLNKQFLRT